VFCFALHKAGSVLLNKLIGDLGKAAGVPVVSIDRFCFQNGIEVGKVKAASTRELLNSPGYCFGVIRGVHSYLVGVRLDERRKIVVVRDPRDILTSFYFSMAKSHGMPQGGEVRDRLVAERDFAQAVSIDDYVFSSSVAFIQRNFDNYIKLESPTTKVYRYEDVIFEKVQWVKDIVDWFSFDVDSNTAAEIATKYDIRPKKENPGRHIRQVTPGNYLNHLSAETIGRLNEQYRTILAHYGYKE